MLIIESLLLSQFDDQILGCWFKPQNKFVLVFLAICILLLHLSLDGAVVYSLANLIFKTYNKNKNFKNLDLWPVEALRHQCCSHSV